MTQRHLSPTIIGAPKPFGASVLLLAATAVLADAGTPPHGELAAAIRSADRPCHHVIAAAPAGKQRWNVQCNAGSYQVSRNAAGKLKIDTAE